MILASLLSLIPDPAHMLTGWGGWALLGLFVIIFIESGVLFPFLPGDSLLVTAAILRTDLGISVWQILLVAAAAAIAGDQVGFWLGRRFGPGLFRDDARVLRTDRLLAASAFFDRYGPVSLVLGRFVPIVRTYIPVAAGTAGMKYARFIRFNIIGALTWVISMVTVGVALGHIPGIAHSIDLIMIVIVAISVLPVLISALRKYRHRDQVAVADETVTVAD